MLGTRMTVPMVVSQRHLMGRALREAPADAQVLSHQLLFRAGLARQVASKALFSCASERSEEVRRTPSPLRGCGRTC